MCKCKPYRNHHDARSEQAKHSLGPKNRELPSVVSISYADDGYTIWLDAGLVCAATAAAAERHGSAFTRRRPALRFDDGFCLQTAKQQNILDSRFVYVIIAMTCTI